MAVSGLAGSLHTADGRRVGGGPCAIVTRRDGAGAPVLHGTCVLQPSATELTQIDRSRPLRLVLADGRALEVRVVKHSLTTCGPEIIRFEGTMLLS